MAGFQIAADGGLWSLVNEGRKKQRSLNSPRSTSELPELEFTKVAFAFTVPNAPNPQLCTRKP